jgi:LPS-assembly protein
LGEFLDPRSQGHLTRTYLDFDLNRPDRTQNRLRVDYNSQFRQGIYSNDTAQYTLGAGSTVSYRLGRDSSANFRYNYLRPEGYTPLSQDNSGQSHTATTDLTFRPQRYFLAGAQTGFDFLRAKSQDVGWQQIGLRTEFIPTRSFSLRALSTYDTISEVWSGVRLDLNARAGQTTVSLGSRYDGYRRAWSNANLYLSNLKVGRTTFSTVLSYNGFTKQFDAQQYNFVYDLHCAEAVLTYSEYSTGFRPGRDVQFFFRLKALSFDSLFGLGRRGQPISTGSGSGF